MRQIPEEIISTFREGIVATQFNEDALRQDLYFSAIEYGASPEDAEELSKNIKLFFTMDDVVEHMSHLAPDASVERIIEYIVRHIFRNELGVYIPQVMSIESFIYFNMDAIAASCKQFESAPLEIHQSRFIEILFFAWNHEKDHYLRRSILDEDYADESKRRLTAIDGGSILGGVGGLVAASKLMEIFSTQTDQTIPLGISILLNSGGALVGGYLTVQLLIKILYRYYSEDEDLANEAARNSTKKITLFDIYFES